MATYTVTSGDTLSAIARRYNTTVSALLQANPKLTTDPKYKNGKVIFTGTKIKLPDTGGGGTSAPQVVTGGTVRVYDPTPPSPTQTATPPPTSTVITPSALASGESGAIGAASIAAQLAAIEEAKKKAAADAAEAARVKEQMRLEEEAFQLDRNKGINQAIQSGLTEEQALQLFPKYTVKADGTETVTYPGIYTPPPTTTTTPTSTTTTTPTPTTNVIDYTGQIATRFVENGQVVFRLPDGTIVKESGVSRDGYFMYTLPDGSVIKSGKKVPSATATPTTTTTTQTPTTTETPTTETATTTPTVQYYRNPTTGALILGPDGKPIVIGPGGSASDVFAYMEALRASTEAKERAALANTFSRRQAQTALEKSQRTTGRDIFSEQKKAINELARRGITSAPGLQTAARRAAGAVPLQRRLDALQQYQQAMSATDLMLAEEQAQADEAQRNALVRLTQASNIANRLSGGTE